ncbi:MAG: carbohydrate ABC transporter permease [Treponema sp.]|nr:carbohydrate ABC transporter permease [Treponema sp.]
MAGKTTASGTVKFTRIKPATNMVFSVLMFVLCFVCIIPILLVVAVSLTDEASLREHGYRLIPKHISLEGYAFLFQNQGMILQALGVSVFITAVGTSLGVVLNSFMGYVLSRREYKLQKFFVWFVFIPMIFSGGLVATYFVISQFLRLNDTIWVLILPLAVSSFNIILCKTFFRATVSNSLIESAKLDGANQFRIFFSIVFPLSLPMLATIGLFMSFTYWNDWFTAMLYIDNPSLLSLQAYLNRLLADINFLAQNAAKLGMTQAKLLAAMPREAARMAIVIVAILPIACAYPFFQRYFISGLMVGAIKG